LCRPDAGQNVEENVAYVNLVIVVFIFRSRIS
jgi:hypothetical protein